MNATARTECSVCVTVLEEGLGPRMLFADRSSGFMTEEHISFSVSYFSCGDCPAATVERVEVRRYLSLPTPSK